MNNNIKNYGITDINGYIRNEERKNEEFFINREKIESQLSLLRMRIKKREMARKAEKILNKK